MPQPLRLRHFRAALRLLRKLSRFRYYPREDFATLFIAQAGTYPRRAIQHISRNDILGVENNVH